MSFTHWLSNRLGLSSRTAGPAQRRTFKPALEYLEDRCVPATLHVTSSADLVTEHGTLRWAVANAQSGDTIVVNEHVENTGITLTQGEIVLGQDVTIKSKNDDPVTISGDNLSRIFEVAPGAHVTLSNLTIVDGAATDTSSLFGVMGGGIFVDAGAALTIRDSTLARNSSYYLGGGIFNGGTLTVSASTLSNNRSYRGGGIDNLGTATITNCVLSDNFANYGGGINNGIDNGNVGYGGGQLTARDCTFVGNVGDMGGGIFNGGVFNFTATITRCTFSANSGGGIYNDGTAAVSNCILSGNFASKGGGIFNGGALTVSGSTLSGNSAYDGGAIANFGTATVRDCTLSANSAGYIGGGIYNDGTLTVEHSSRITGNTAPVGFGADVFNDTPADGVVLYLDSTSIIGILDGPGTVVPI